MDPSASTSELKPAESESKSLLKEGVKKTWLFAFLLSSFLTIASFVFINSTQAYILTDLLDIPRTKLGSIQGNLSSMDEVVSMVMVIIWGVLSDRVGRRLVFSTGFLLMALATFLYPLASSVYGSSDTANSSNLNVSVSFFNSLLFFRLIFACGGAATSDMLTVVLGDYAAEGKRSKLAGFLGVSTGLGACFGALFLNRLPTFFTHSQKELVTSNGTIYASFWITAVLLIGGAVISGFGVRKPPQQVQQDPLIEAEAAKGNKCPVNSDSSSLNSSTKCWWKRIIFGFRAIKTHPALLAAYLGGFVARGDSIILSVFLPPWIASFYARNNLCQVDPSVVSDATMYITKCPEAKRLVSTLTGISNLSALLAAPLVGNFADRLGPLRSLGLPAILGACAYGGMLLIGDPRSKIVMFMAVLQGFAQIGMIITSVSLVAKESPPHARGAISGVYSLFGAIGIITVSKIGGALTEIWTETGPFSVIAAANIILLIVLLYLRK